jgi:murein DD-endopeptidase MepM/ murein hydrolase activator NlpD
MADWTAEYLRLSSPLDPSEVTIEAAQPAAALAQRIPETLALRGRSPLTSFQLTNIPHGQTVWFVWTNITDARAQIYDQMVASFNLGARTPISLAAAFGPGFTPLARTLPDVGNQGEASINAISLPNSNWIVPTPAGTTYNVKCGSSAHTGTAAYALDIQVAVSTGVYSTHRSWVDFAGWNSDGYGNLIRASTDFIYPRTYTAYYAHLSSFVASGGQQLGGGTLIAYSGNTGNSSGPHLHFHVRAASDAVDLRNLNNFAENSNYPSGNANCGTVRR